MRLLVFVLVPCSARYGNAHQTRQTRLFNVPCVKQWYTGASSHWRISTYILLRSFLWWAEDRTRNPRVGSSAPYHKARCSRLALFGSLCSRIQHITPYNMKLRQSNNCHPIDNTGPTFSINRKYPRRLTLCSIKRIMWRQSHLLHCATTSSRPLVWCQQWKLQEINFISKSELLTEKLTLKMNIKNLSPDWMRIFNLCASDAEEIQSLWNKRVLEYYNW